MPFRAGVRAVLLAVLAALAWLIWGATIAQAAVPAPDADALLQPASTLVRTIPPPAQPLITKAGNVAAATPSSVLTPGSSLADAPAAAVIPVLAGASDTVTGSVETLPLLPLVQTPVQLPLPLVLPLPEPLPGLLPVPGPLPVVPLPTRAPVAVAGAAAGDIGAGTPGATRRFGFAPARDLAETGGSPAAASRPSGPSAPPAPGPLPVAALQVQTGDGGSASSGGFGGAADIAGPWPALPVTTGAINRPVTASPPANPAFDPGSSPD